NLPNNTVNDSVVDYDTAGARNIATDIGVFQSTDGGKQWVTVSAGLPKVLVRALNLHRASRTLRAVTYGRSMWDLAVPVSTPSLAPHIDSATLATTALTLSGRNFSAA